MGTSAQLLLFLLINMNILVILLSLITTGLCQSLDIGRSCGGRLTAPSGTIMSPGYPSGYSNNQDCEWTIGPAPRNMVVLNNQLRGRKVHRREHGLGTRPRVSLCVSMVSL